MSLTDDWKAGKLQNGWYFCKFENDEIFPALNIDNDFDDCQLKVVEVLAPCNYEELQRLKEKLDEALKSSAEFEMKAYDLERDLKSAKSHNRYYLKAIKDMTAALDYMTDENEKCEVKIKKLEEENAQHKEYCCCLEKEKLRLHLTHRDNEIRQKVDYIHELLETKKNYKNLLKECAPCVLSLKIFGVENCDGTEINDLLPRIKFAIGESEA